jgi:hypothetical protein
MEVVAAQGLEAVTYASPIVAEQKADLPLP